MRQDTIGEEQGWGLAASFESAAVFKRNYKKKKSFFKKKKRKNPLMKLFLSICGVSFLCPYHSSKLLTGFCQRFYNPLLFPLIDKNTIPGFPELPFSFFLFFFFKKINFYFYFFLSLCTLFISQTFASNSPLNTQQN